MREKLRAVARALDNIFNPGLKTLNKKIGFFLFTFEYGEKNGRANYVSNGADRDDVVKMMEEAIARFKAGGYGKHEDE